MRKTWVYFCFDSWIREFVKCGDIATIENVVHNKIGIATIPDSEYNEIRVSPCCVITRQSRSESLERRQKCLPGNGT